MFFLLQDVLNEQKPVILMCLKATHNRTVLLCYSTLTRSICIVTNNCLGGWHCFTLHYFATKCF